MMKFLHKASEVGPHNRKEKDANCLKTEIPNLKLMLGIRFCRYFEEVVEYEQKCLNRTGKQ